MSIYELIDYDALLTRVGIPHGYTTNPDGTLSAVEWFCGDNPPLNYTYDEVGLTYDDVTNYDGRSQHSTGGLCLTADVNVNGLTLNTVDENGTMWLCTGIDGWWTLPPSEILDVPRPYWDGSMLTTGRYLSRTITVSGCFMPPGPEWVWKNRDTILRCASIVRGVGLIATCGNQSPTNPEKLPDASGVLHPNDFFDPAKMAIIQMADVPLVDTVKSNGFTQFSMSFRCAYPTKASIAERSQSIPVPDPTKEVGRAYSSFSQRQNVALPPDDPASRDTSYNELKLVVGDASLSRTYSDVKFFNPDSPIKDENGDFAGIPAVQLLFQNNGNYFAFPTIVIQQTTGLGTGTSGKKLEISNFTTSETLRLVKDIPLKHRLVVDSMARRVSLVDDNYLGDPNSWSWNSRDYLALESEWISLAPGENKFTVQKDTGVGAVTAAPTMYWRDTWIG